MIHEQPIFRPLGDCYLGVEFGDEADLRLSFRGLAMINLLARAKIPGIVEMQPTIRQVAIVYDRTVTTYGRLCDAVKSVLDEAMAVVSIASRRVVLPTWYDDPWSDETARKFGVQNNIDIVASVAGINRQDVAKRHASCLHWVTLIAFAPGCAAAYPLDKSVVFSAPKYVVPRTYTAARTIVTAGAATAIHPVAGPGGYQMIGRTAVDLYDPLLRNKGLSSEGILLKAGDRLEFRPIGALEYEDIRDRIAAGKYSFEIYDETYDVGAHDNLSTNQIQRAV
jgi:urea carboxylase